MKPIKPITAKNIWQHVPNVEINQPTKAEGNVVGHKLAKTLEDDLPLVQVVHVSHIQALIEELSSLVTLEKKLVDDLYKSRVFADVLVPISANVGYEVDYLERRYLFVLSQNFIQLSLGDGGNVNVAALTWTIINYRRGMKIYAPSVPDSSPVFILIRACDELQSLSLSQGTAVLGVVALTGGSATIGNVGSTGDYPVGALPITATSGNQANAVATATLAAAVGKTTYITGFEVTGTGATGVLVVIATVTNTITGTLSYTYVFVAGATTANQALIVEFSEPIPANAVNTAIVVSCPASGLGGTNNVVNAHGYQL